MFIRALLLWAVLALGAAAHAQDYPSRLIKIVVPLPPGGGPSIVARLLSDKLRDRFGQPVIVENRAGAAGNVGADAVFKSPPDGYTLLLAAPGPLVINKGLYGSLPFEPEAFVPISLVVMSPTVLVAHPKVPAQNLRELIAYAKANPGRLNYASPGNGTTGHLSAEMLKSLAGIDIVHVPYKGLVPARTDLIAGQVDMLFSEVGGALPLIQAGKLRALATGGEKRNAFLPDVSTLSEVLPGLIVVPWFGMVAPPGTPAAIANQLSEAVAAALKQPDLLQQVQAQSLEAVGSTPAEMDRFMRREREFWTKAVRLSGAKPD